MLNSESRFRHTTFAALAILAAITLAPRSMGAEGKASNRADQNASLAAWTQIAAVLQNPRCLNCHQLTSPLQGDTRRTHVPRVVRGTGQSWRRRDALRQLPQRYRK